MWIHIGQAVPLIVLPPNLTGVSTEQQEKIIPESCFNLIMMVSFKLLKMTDNVISKKSDVES